MMVPAVVFDLGGVLIDWNPRYLYRQLIGEPEAIERFLGSVCTQAWNEQQDGGRPCAEAVAELVARHPEQEELVRAYYSRFGEMIGGAIGGTVEILAALRDRGVPLYALSNWSAETWPHARDRFEFLTWFRGLVISGEEGVRKPDPTIFRILFERYQLDPAATLFIDDVAANIAGAHRAGMRAIHFREPAQLRDELRGHGLL